MANTVKTSLYSFSTQPVNLYNLYEEHLQLELNNVSKKFHTTNTEPAFIHRVASACNYKLLLYHIKLYILNNNSDNHSNLVKYINSYNHYEYTPLHFTVENGNYDCTALLVRYGADILLKSGNLQETAIDLARHMKHISKEYLRTFDYLIELKHEFLIKQCIKEQLNGELEALCLQTNFNSKIENQMRNLIKKGGQIESLDPLNYRLIYLACYVQNEPLVRTALQMQNIPLYGYAGEKLTSLLHIACELKLNCRFGLAKRFPHLISFSDAFGNRPMHISALNGDFDFLQFLFDRKQFAARLPNTSTTLMQGIEDTRVNDLLKATNEEELNIFCDSPSKSKLAKKTKKSKLKDKKISSHSENGNLDETNQKIDVYNSFYKIPKNEESLNLLSVIENFSIGLKTQGKQTLMHFACANGHSKIVNLLVDYCERKPYKCPRLSEFLNSIDSNLLSPLECALKGGYFEISLFLLSKGASFCFASKQTLIEITIVNENDELIRFLSKLTQTELAHYLKILSLNENENLTNKLLLHLNSLDRFSKLRFLVENGLNISLFNYSTICKGFIVEKRQENLQFMLENFAMVQNESLKLDEFLNSTIRDISLLNVSVKCCDLQMFELLLNKGADFSKFVPNKPEENLLLISAKNQSEDGFEIFKRLVEAGVIAEYSTILKQIYNECSNEKRAILIALDTFQCNYIHIIREFSHSFVDSYEETQQECSGKLKWSGYGIETIDFRLLSIACKIIKEMIWIMDEIQKKHQNLATLSLNSPEVYQCLASKLFSEDFIFNDLSHDFIPTSNITFLNLSSNNLISIPIALFEFPNLETLLIANNKLMQLPELESTPDTNSNNSNEEMITGEYKCKKLRFIDVSQNCLQKLPEDLFYLPKLAEVYASNNHIRSLPESTWLSCSLSILNLDNNKLSYLIDDSKRSSIVRDLSQQFRNLKKTVIMSTKRKALMKKNSSSLTDATDEEENNSNSYSMVQEIDNNDFAQLSLLNRLSLNKNNFVIYPYEIPCLAPNLCSLKLDNNRIKSINLLRALPKSIRDISLDNNQIEDVYETVAKPSKCSSPYLEAVKRNGEWCHHRLHHELPFLQVISLNNNKLNYFPIKCFNKSPENPFGTSSFPLLTILSLEKNQLLEISEQISLLSSLKYLHISHNPSITQLPTAIKSLTNLISLSMEGLTIDNIPSQLNGSTFAEEIRAHFVSFSDVIPYRALKLIFIGDQHKGKSYLLRQLTRSKINCNTGKDLDDENIGLKVTEWTYQSTKTYTNPIHFICWDFIGDTRFFPAYSGFLCQRAIYIITWDFEDNIDGFEGVKNWLSRIEGCAPSSTCLLVCINFNKYESRLIDITSVKRGLESRYLLEIDSVRQINTTHLERSISQLREDIFNVASNLREKYTAKQSYIEQLVPKFYVKLEELINKMKNDGFKNNRGFPIFWRRTFYETIMGLFAFGNIKVSHVEFCNALDFLHKNRHVLYFGKDAYVNDYIVLDVEWLCNTLVTILNNNNNSNVSPISQNSHLTDTPRGILAKNCVKRTLEVNGKINETDIQLFLKFARKFEVLLELTDKYYFLPTLLGNDRSEAVNLLFEIDLNFKMDDTENNDEGVKMSTDLFTFFKNPSLSGHNKPLSETTYSFLRVINRLRVRDESVGKTSSRQREWNRFFSASNLPNDLWPRLLARIVADKAYLNSVIFYMLPYIHSLPADEQQFIQGNLEKNIYWKVWKTGLSLRMMSNEILTLSPFPLTSIKCEKISIDSIEEFRNRISSYVSSAFIHLTVREWEPINYTNVRISIEESFTNPSRFLQLATWLLDHTQSHINYVLQEWNDARNILQRQVINRKVGLGCRFSQSNINIYIPCQNCFEEFFSITQTHSDSNKSKISTRISKYDELNTSVQITPGSSQKNEKIPSLYTLGYLCENESSQTLVKCGIHGPILMTCLAPDILLQDFPASMLYSNDWVSVGVKLGEGAYGTVHRGYICLHSHDNRQDIALKQPKQDDMTKLDIYQCCAQEARIIMQLSHKSILKMVGVCREPYLILMEYALNLDFRSVIKKFHEFGIYISSSAIIDTCRQVSSALAYLHSQQIIFRDLKPENILVFEFPTPDTLQLDTGNVCVKLADYGVASYIGPYGIFGLAGTATYSAPEVNQGDEIQLYDTSIDSYSFGLLMYCIITLETPFLRDELVYAMKKAASGHRPVVPNSALPQSVYLYDLMRWCWTPKPRERPTCSQINTIVNKEAFKRLVFICKLTQTVGSELVSASVINSDSRKSGKYDVFSESHASNYECLIEDIFDGVKDTNQVIKFRSYSFDVPASLMPNGKKNSIRSVLNNCEIWYCMSDQSLKYFEVSKHAYIIRHLPLKQTVTCMVFAVNHMWVGTLSNGIIMFSTRNHKITDKWCPLENMASIPEILFLYYSERNNFVIASLSSDQLAIFNFVHNLRQSVSYINLQSPALSLLTVHSSTSEQIWCGCEGYITRYLIENIDNDGLTPQIITKYGDDVHFPQGKLQSQKLKYMVAIPDQDIVLCANGSLLCKFSISNGLWIGDINCAKRNMSTNKVYTHRVTSLTIYKSVIFVGTGSGSVLFIDSKSLRIIVHFSEYSGPIRMLSIASICNTTSGFGSVIFRPKLPSRGSKNSDRADSQSNLEADSNAGVQLLLLCVGTHFNGVVENYLNYPCTLESDFDSYCGPTSTKQPTKPHPDDTYLSLWDINKWIN